jgi:ubiquinone/menaquinone biosynthesis C-methylase UbiE
MGGDRDRVDYDAVAPEYDRRYASRSYAGVADTLAAVLAHEGGAVLEVGCGTGHWLAKLGSLGHRSFGVDASSGMLRRARDAGAERIAAATAGALPFAEASFDAVVCINALHHFPDPTAFVREARRTLRTGGRFVTIGMDPHGGVRRWVVYDFFAGTRDADLRRFAAPADIRRWLAEAGFEEIATCEAERMEERVAGRAVLASPFLGRRGTSQLALLDDAAYEEGIRGIEAAVDRGAASGRAAEFVVDLSLYATLAVKR